MGDLLNEAARYCRRLLPDWATDLAVVLKHLGAEPKQPLDTMPMDLTRKMPQKNDEAHDPTVIVDDVYMGDAATDEENAEKALRERDDCEVIHPKDP